MSTDRERRDEQQPGEHQPADDLEELGHGLARLLGAQGGRELDGLQRALELDRQRPGLAGARW